MMNLCKKTKGEVTIDYNLYLEEGKIIQVNGIISNVIYICYHCG